MKVATEVSPNLSAVRHPERSPQATVMASTTVR